MDLSAFDRLARAVAGLTSRRNLLALGLSLVGSFASLLPGLSEARGKSRRRHGQGRRQQGHDRGKAGEQKKKKRHKRRCSPESAARTCAGRCGTIANNCNQPVDCGSCACGSACPVCQTCNSAAGRCETSQAFVGQACGLPEQFCQADGTCVCDATSCESGQRCNGIVCVCDATSCPTGCCDADRRCRIGDAVECGTGGRTCNRCPDCNTCNGRGECVVDLDQNRTTCHLDDGTFGVCCNGSCCSGCCDAEDSCGPCIAFVTTTKYTGMLGGLSGGDAKCQERAQAAGLVGTYQAWLSSTNRSPSNRFRCTSAICSANGYVRVDGEVIAVNWDDLTSELTGSELLHPISISELNTEENTEVWTNTWRTGIPTVTDPRACCQTWTAAITPFSGEIGSSGRTDDGWTAINVLSCDNLLSLYCFQQN